MANESRDWSTEKGIADEAHFNEFVLTAGGELVAPIISRPGIKNADYLFRDNRVVGEHKILETDFSHTPETLAKVDAAFTKYPGEAFESPTHPLYRELFGILRVPIRRIVEKANKQIKDTKIELSLNNHRGVLFLVNDQFRSAPPTLVRDLIASIVREKERYRSIDVVVYLTNHFVEVSEVPFASLLWSPIYKGHPAEQLHTFVDWLGGQWSQFMRERLTALDGSAKMSDINWNRAYVVTGTRRNERYEGDD